MLFTSFCEDALSVTYLAGNKRTPLNSLLSKYFAIAIEMSVLIRDALALTTFMCVLSSL